jgi:acetylornithine deacetylase/succinyl-diaminopimelate desuccinylase-like protein
MGTPHVLAKLHEESGYQPAVLIAGERTGEKGSELWGEICAQNRGVMRFDVIARGQRGHSGVAGASASLADRIYQAYADLPKLLQSFLTLQSPDSWKSQLTFPFIKVGTPGIYNVTAAEAVMGVEVRPIPQDDLGALRQAVQDYCSEHALELQVSVMENAFCIRRILTWLHWSLRGTGLRAGATIGRKRAPALRRRSGASGADRHRPARRQ